ncbi:DUF2442 domain-containing protein [Bifidobacterium sp. SMB2]|uniref:DUF2442 domain-containing protein n=1 Tax=Bifidobacterium saimiriisciurei TaxID=2661627 RepID=A0ABX0CAK3_9BIFI|nr:MULTISPECIES: DUF2442 domain-containing protein [Bifidobacterium]NEG96082.1 DUF2442 domain-containing protein [Bifidobacterium sp. SMB2]NEH10840.1 DUF2442 domain-containing protein [Bifidobacterium saimiriisciurei]
MFEVNGILYADEPAQELEVRSARVADDRIMLVTFSTGETRLCDFTEMYDDVPSFAPLRDEKTFEDFHIDHGVLTWCDGDIDISPTYLYEHSYEYIAHGELVSV